MKSEITKSRYINPFTDFGFKKIFGEEPNKDLLIDFLNQLLDKDHKIKSLNFKKNDQLGSLDKDRKVIFDLYCESRKGEKFIVELQKVKQKWFKDRSVFYSTFPIREQAPKGEWDYNLKSVYTIGILDFRFDDEDKDKTVVNEVKLMDTKKKVVFYDKLTFIYLQMPNFTKTEKELSTRFDKWLYVLKHLDKFERIPEQLKEKIFQKVFKIAEISNLSKDELYQYEEDLKAYRDIINSINYAIEKGYEKAVKEFSGKLAETELKIIEARKREEDAQKSEIEARKDEKAAMIKLARKMKKYGEPVEEIMKETGIKKEEIDKL